MCYSNKKRTVEHRNFYLMAGVWYEVQEKSLLKEWIRLKYSFWASILLQLMWSLESLLSFLEDKRFPRVAKFDGTQVDLFYRTSRAEASPL